MKENLEVNQEQKLAEFKPSYLSLVQRGKALVITNEETKSQAIDLIRELENLAEKYKKLREYLVKPIKDHVKKIEKDIKPYEKEIEVVVGDFQSGLRGQVASFETKMAEERRQEEERLRGQQQEKYKKDVAKAEKNGQIPPPPPPPVSVQEKKEGDVSYGDKFLFDIIDEKLIPREYLAIDEKKINKVISAGVRNIPGLRIYSIKVPIIREEKTENL